MTTSAQGLIPLPRSRSSTTTAGTRFRLHRAGIQNVWQYDEQEFAFGDGRLLLRGKNGAGSPRPWRCCSRTCWTATPERWTRPVPGGRRSPG
ncbi:hypothetical protein NKH18_23915 [Streptomyces sp. M10(2022)]